jgi:O-methyltransferase
VSLAERVEDWHEILAVAAALRTGMLEALATPRSLDDLVAGLGLDRRAAWSVVRALEGFGHVDAADQTALVLTARGRALLGPDEEGRDIGAEIMLAERAIANHLRLPEVLRSGRPVDDLTHAPPEEHARFLRAMRNTAAGRVPAVLAAIGPPSPGARLIDLGGAPGTYARAFAGAGWDVTVLDLPDALDLTRAGLEAEGIEVVEGDMTRGVPGGPWDCIYLGNVTHLFGPDVNRDVIWRCAGALMPGGLLAVQDILRARSGQAARFSVLMLLGTEAGDTYSEDDYRGWMHTAGCPVERIVDVEDGWHQLVLGRREG